jgi:hypothetical protein
MKEIILTYMSVINVALSFQMGSTGNTSDMNSGGAVFVSRQGGGLGTDDTGRSL